MRPHLIDPANRRKAVEQYSDNLKRLTPRERDILSRMLEADSIKETAQVLGVSPRTVEVHRSRVLGKLSARSTADLIRIVTEASSGRARREN